MNISTLTLFTSNPDTTIRKNFDESNSNMIHRCEITTRRFEYLMNNIVLVEKNDKTIINSEIITPSIRGVKNFELKDLKVFRISSTNGFSYYGIRYKNEIITSLKITLDALGLTSDIENDTVLYFTIKNKTIKLSLGYSLFEGKNKQTLTNADIFLYLVLKYAFSNNLFRDTSVYNFKGTNVSIFDDEGDIVTFVIQDFSGYRNVSFDVFDREIDNMGTYMNPVFNQTDALKAANAQMQSAIQHMHQQTQQKQAATQLTLDGCNFNNNQNNIQNMLCNEALITNIVNMAMPLIVDTIKNELMKMQAQQSQGVI